ncbi:Ppx/GppA family phosphatase [Sphingomonas sp. GCM10030256]|uniref:Ppx/GppA phosphatase family protein n=1 Tax=Sphingomonas sp. GCM10030256 TaxID=3273427 RepID=UPI00361078D9
MKHRPFGPVGIIDIGSNSVRFVAFGGSERVPSLLFNEKVMAGLGRGIAEDGLLDDEAMEHAVEALGRFRLLAKEMKLKKLHVVATAAVRDAANADDFVDRSRKVGIDPVVISGEEEARLSALGVISAIPAASGIAADLGGGSLELIPVEDGRAGQGVSLPLGILRVGDKPTARALARQIGEVLAGTELLDSARGRSLYLVGGSFRAFAQLDLHLSDNPLPIVHQHCFSRARVGELRDVIRATPLAGLRERTGLQSVRASSLPATGAILEALGRVLRPDRFTISAFGLREGILFDDLSAEVRGQDPLLAAALEVGERLGRFGDHGALLDRWIGPLFGDDTPTDARIRLAACLLADVAWNAHPDFRAEWAIDTGVHGNWVGIDGHGRALLGRALSSAFGGDGAYDDKIGGIVDARELEHADHWGRAIRLAQRISGGTASLLDRSTVRQQDGELILTLKGRDRALYSDAVAKRHRQLASALDLRAVLDLL